MTSVEEVTTRPTKVKALMNREGLVALSLGLPLVMPLGYLKA